MLGHRPFNPFEWGFVLSGLVRVADVLAIVICGLFAYWLRNDLADIPSHYLVALLVATLMVLYLGETSGLYRYEGLHQFSTQFGRLIGLWLVVFLILIALAFLTKTSDLFSRIWATSWFLTGFTALVVVRILVVRRIESRRRDGRLARRIAIVGSGVKAGQVRAFIESQNPTVMRLAGQFAPHPTPDPAGPELSPGLAGGMDRLDALIEDSQVDEVILALDEDRDEIITPLLRTLGRRAVDVRLAPDTVSLSIPLLGLQRLGGIGLLEVQRRPISAWDRILKRLEDLGLGLLALCLLGPVMLLIALLIRLDSPGPILFRQQRHGFHNNSFTMLKFRTMTAEASARDGEDGTSESREEPIRQAGRDDARVTRIGRILRRTSLDELPQLFNVLKGDMSLVGPRPHAMSHDREFARLIDDYIARHRVKPGITGWAQIHGFRGETDTEEKIRGRVEHDLYYIDNWSLWLDIKILVMTVLYGFIHRNAY